MKPHDATEEAYKNGYEDGKRDAVKHGKWEDRPNPQWPAYDIRHCNVCGWNIPKNNLRRKDLNWKHCPHCGARMDGDGNA